MARTRSAPRHVMLRNNAKTKIYGPLFIVVSPNYELSRTASARCRFRRTLSRAGALRRDSWRGHFTCLSWVRNPMQVRSPRGAAVKRLSCCCAVNLYHAATPSSSPTPNWDFLCVLITFVRQSH